MGTRKKCKLCNSFAISSGITHGKRRYKNYCSRHHRARYKQDFYPKHKGLTCSFCGFIPVHMCQLDVDHIDGDHTNNEITNLQTLCANCHRLKTLTDWQRDQ